VLRRTESPDVVRAFSLRCGGSDQAL